MNSKGAIWVARILVFLIVALLLFSSSMKLMGNAEFVEMWTTKLGFPKNTLLPIGILEMLVALTFAVPRTTVLGAILLTGYMGGAIVAHVRIGEAPMLNVLIGVIAWGTVFIRDPRLRALLPVVR